MEFEISDHETLPNRVGRPMRRHVDEPGQIRQMADDATPDATSGLREPVFQLTQQG